MDGQKPYNLLDEFGVINSTTGELQSGILYKLKQSLGLGVLNFQYGYITELQHHLDQWAKSDEFLKKKFPLVWIAHPFTIKRENNTIYGETVDMRIYLLEKSDKNYKPYDRINIVYKPVLDPLYEGLLKQMMKSEVFDNKYWIPHNVTDRFYWGENQKQVIPDTVDCKEISNLKLKINFNCEITLT